MDKLLQQFEICFSNPEDYLDGSAELKNSCLSLDEELFSYCHDKTGKFPTGPLSILHTEGFDNEQIWEQIQLLNQPTIKFAKKKIKEISDMKTNSTMTQSVDDGDKPEGLLNDSDENEAESDESEYHFNDHANSSDVTSKQSTQTQDTFFNLAEMNRFLQDEDRKYENRLDSKQDGNNEIDLFREMSSEEEDDHLMYDDFFDPPSNHNDGENNSEEGNDDESDDEVMDESAEQQISEMDDTQLSSHQKQQQKVINTLKMSYKGGQVTKPSIVVKMPYKLLYIIQVKRFLMVITSWPYLISTFLVACDHLQYCFLLASHFFTARLFLFSIYYELLCVCC